MKSVNGSYRWVMLFVLLGTLVACPRAGAQAKTQQVVLKGARLIDGTGRPAIENSVLVIEGDHVVAAGKSGAVSIPKDAAVQDMTDETADIRCPGGREDVVDQRENGHQQYAADRDEHAKAHGDPAFRDRREQQQEGGNHRDRAADLRAEARPA